jgi:uncharacterized membrane protein required for colicin V production
MWTSEIFSVNVRSQAVGMASQCQNVANTVFQQFFPTFLAKEGLKCLFFFMAVNILLAIFVYFFIPETKGIALEQMDVIFGGADHTEKGAQILSMQPESKAIEINEGVEVKQDERKKETV